MGTIQLPGYNYQEVETHKEREQRPDLQGKADLGQAQARLGDTAMAGLGTVANFMTEKIKQADLKRSTDVYNDNMVKTRQWEHDYLLKMEQSPLDAMDARYLALTDDEKKTPNYSQFMKDRKEFIEGLSGAIEDKKARDAFTQWNADHQVSVGDALAKWDINKAQELSYGIFTKGLQDLIDIKDVNGIRELLSNAKSVDTIDVKQYQDFTDLASKEISKANLWDQAVKAGMNGLSVLEDPARMQFSDYLGRATQIPDKEQKALVAAFKNHMEENDKKIDMKYNRYYLENINDVAGLTKGRDSLLDAGYTQAASQHSMVDNYQARIDHLMAGDKAGKDPDTVFDHKIRSEVADIITALETKSPLAIVPRFAPANSKLRQGQKVTPAALIGYLNANAGAVLNADGTYKPRLEFGWAMSQIEKYGSDRPPASSAAMSAILAASKPNPDTKAPATLTQQQAFDAMDKFDTALASGKYTEDQLGSLAASLITNAAVKKAGQDNLPIGGKAGKNDTTAKYINDVANHLMYDWQTKDADTQGAVRNQASQIQNQIAATDLSHVGVPRDSQPRPFEKGGSAIMPNGEVWIKFDDPAHPGDSKFGFVFRYSPRKEKVDQKTHQANDDNPDLQQMVGKDTWKTVMSPQSTVKAMQSELDVSKYMEQQKTIIKQADAQIAALEAQRDQGVVPPNLDQDIFLEQSRREAAQKELANMQAKQLRMKAGGK